MMKSAVSIYPGLEIDVLTYKRYLQQAKRVGVKFAFLSLHIPESNDQMIEDFNAIMKEIKLLKLKAIVDIDKSSLAKIDLVELPIYALRLDDGFTCEDVIKFLQTSDYAIYLNASTVDQALLEKISQVGNFATRVNALHNFYPKPYSGLDYATFAEKNAMFKRMNVKVGAFVASLHCPRLPLYKGLPTIEDHRRLSVAQQASELRLLGVDLICVGDYLASEQELQWLGETTTDVFVFDLIETPNALDKASVQLLCSVHTLRDDQSAYLMRSMSSRTDFKANVYPALNSNRSIKRGDVTVDNERYPRYHGELDIWLKDAEQAVDNVNLLGRVLISDWLQANRCLIKRMRFNIVNHASIVAGGTAGAGQLDPLLARLNTEQINQDSYDIDRVSTLQMAQIINNEDQKVARAVTDVLPVLAQTIDAIHDRIKGNGRLVYVGAGTSGRIGVLDASEIWPTYGIKDKVFGLIAGGDGALRMPVENAEDNEGLGAEDLKAFNLTSNDVVVGIGASGRTPYVVGALRYAKSIKALTVGLCMVDDSPFATLADYMLSVPTGAETITGSTRMKAGSATKMILNIISTCLMVKLNRVYHNLMVDVQATNHKLEKRCCSIIKIIVPECADELIQSTLAANDYNCPVTIVMLKRNVNATIAKEMLVKHHNCLAEIIG